MQYILIILYRIIVFGGKNNQSLLNNKFMIFYNIEILINPYKFEENNNDFYIPFSIKLKIQQICGLIKKEYI